MSLVRREPNRTATVFGAKCVNPFARRTVDRRNPMSAILSGEDADARLKDSRRCFPPKLKEQNAFGRSRPDTAVSSICTEILALQPFPHGRAGDTYEYAIRFGILRESRSAYLGSLRFVLPPILMPRYHASRAIQVDFRERSSPSRRSQSRGTPSRNARLCDVVLFLPSFRGSLFRR